MNILGDFETLLNKQFGHRPSLSFLLSNFDSIEKWKEKARLKVKELLASPSNVHPSNPRVVNKITYEGLEIETIRWKLPYGPEAEAFFLKPEGEKGPLPGIIAMHDHGSFKYYGKEKITRTGKNMHHLLIKHQEKYYQGKAWANEIAKLGFGVLVPDVFTFGSRRIDFSKTPKNMLESLPLPKNTLSNNLKTNNKRNDKTSRTIPPPRAVENYNAIAREHEHVIAKSLFSAGTTWPGVFVAEDMAALDYLTTRQDIDNNRIGCCGLSGGGLRTDFLAGLDERIKCSVTVGFMSTWRDFAFNIAHKHTWMTYLPHLPRYLDFPEILGLRAPLPTMVLATTEDPLYSLSEVREAEKELFSIYERAGAPECFRFSYYDGPHYFNLAMQEEAFKWFKRWLL